MVNKNIVLLEGCICGKLFYTRKNLWEIFPIFMDLSVDEFQILKTKRIFSFWFILWFYGLRGGIRTPNNPSRNRGLYPVELHAECYRTKKESGGSSRIRTCEGLPLGGLANPCFQPLSHGSVLVDVEGVEPTNRFQRGFTIPVL